MTREDGRLIEWIMPLAFIGVAAYVVWNFPRFIISFGWAEETGALMATNPPASILDFAFLIALPIVFVIGTMTVKAAKMEFFEGNVIDKSSLFIGRVTMMIILLTVLVMTYEVFVRYVLEKPTLWANELSLWMAAFVFMLAGLYAMQQRSHIRIFLLYDVCPRWLQRLFDCISTFLIVLFAIALIYGAYGEAFAKLLRWETFGTAFDPPLPATVKPMLLLVMTLVALQAVVNLISDWNKEPEVHTDEPDEEEIEALRSTLKD